MSKANATENDMLNAVLRGEDPSWRSNASRYIALYTADPGEAGSANTNEATFGGYARVTVTASSAFTAASGGSSSNAVEIAFPECTSGSNTVTHVAIVETSSGSGQIFYSGALTSSRSISSGITGRFAVGGLVITED